MDLEEFGDGADPDHEKREGIDTAQDSKQKEEQGQKESARGESHEGTRSGNDDEGEDHESDSDTNNGTRTKSHKGHSRRRNPVHPPSKDPHQECQIGINDARGRKSKTKPTKQLKGLMRTHRSPPSHGTPRDKGAHHCNGSHRNCSDLGTLQPGVKQHYNDSSGDQYSVQSQRRERDYGNYYGAKPARHTPQPQTLQPGANGGRNDYSLQPVQYELHPQKKQPRANIYRGQHDKQPSHYQSQPQMHMRQHNM
ncbi:hypothetical protein K458DRAFT_410696 [Lentithecium fluviatile CBS 122367]|uniref:Uncharacterized protein n=1 Tax=Lentithecium fluviatile CBS 122367 TaxID=1168545 RepID=A0A6G1ID11_9PLEO|nr:hypothetical protein K458DRAFT_410696 [Lentithecium fluviatile CBS 122367]